jgi:hypothetical protein
MQALHPVAGRFVSLDWEGAQPRLLLPLRLASAEFFSRSCDLGWGSWGWWWLHFGFDDDSPLGLPSPTTVCVLEVPCLKQACLIHGRIFTFVNLARGAYPHQDKMSGLRAAGL